MSLSLAVVLACTVIAEHEGPRVVIERAPAGDPVASALNAVARHRESLGIDRAMASGLKLSATLLPTLGHVAIVDVRGALAGVGLARPVARVLVASGSLRAITGFGPVPPPCADAGKRLPAERALAVVASSGLAGAKGSAAADLVTVPGPHCTKVAWRIDPPADRHHLQNPIFLVDATTGALSVSHDVARDSRVRTFVHNPVVTPLATESELIHVEAMPTFLQGPYFRAKNCIDLGGAVCAPKALATADAAGDFLYPAPQIDVPTDVLQPEDLFAEASAYYYADKFHAWLESLGHPGLPCHVAGQSATLVVNYRLVEQGQWMPLDNAVYTGDCNFTLVLGQGAAVDWAYDGDVVYHELGHGVIAQQLGPDVVLGGRRLRSEAVVDDPGALGEAIADFLAHAFSGDPVHAEYITDHGGSGGRNAANDFTCPSALVGQIHWDSEVFTAALWDARSDLGDDLIPAIIDGIALLAPDTTFEEAAVVFEEVVAAELGDAAGSTIHGRFQERNLVDCERIVPWDRIERGIWLIPKGWDDGGYAPMRPPPWQMSFLVPVDADTLDLSFDVEVLTSPGWDPLTQIEMVIKHDAPIVFTYEPSETGVLVNADSEEHIRELDDGHARIPVKPGRTVYAALFNRGVHTAILSNFTATYSASDDGEDTDPPETGSTAATGEDGHQTTVSGCSCRSIRAGSWAWVIGVLIAFARRRRAH